MDTSKMCSACGHIDAANRPHLATFKCVSCGHAEAADTNAAENIAARAAVMRPIMVPDAQNSVQRQGQATRL